MSWEAPSLWNRVFVTISSMSAPVGSGNHAMQDYQMQLMLLEQQNRKRLMLACQEQDTIALDRNDKSRSPLTSSFSASEVSNEIVRPLPNQGKRCIDTRAYDIMQERLRRVPPEHPISKLPATEESFQLMINTPQSEQPQVPPRRESDLRHGLFTPLSEHQSHLSHGLLTPNTSHLPGASMSNPPKLVSSRTGQYHTSETYEPPWSNSESNSITSTRSTVSIDSCKTYDSRCPEVRTPDDCWAFEPNFKVPTDQDLSFGHSFSSEADFVESQNLGHSSKHHFNKDILIRKEAAPLPCVTNSVINKTLGAEITYDQREPSNPSPIFRSGSETCSWSSDNDTDWGDDEFDDTYQTIGTLFIDGVNISGEQELPNLVVRPVLSEMKQKLVDLIMVEFWQIFNQGKEINVCEDIISTRTPLEKPQEQDTSHGDQHNQEPCSKSSTKLDVQANGARSTSTSDQRGKRNRQSQDEDEDDEIEERNPKRPKALLSPPQSQDHTSKFACPYRKHDAKKYCVKRWRSCALTPLETVARVKGHLYRHHRIFPCQRCKRLFENQQGVNDHLMELESCQLLEVAQPDGITNEMVERLRSKKKAHREQSMEERWKEIYRILFPGETVPNPFFEEIQEDVIQSPDSQELAAYEDFCRRELPRVFRASLEELVNNSTQPLEEELRSQLMELIRNAQDRVFSRYRSSSTTTETPARGAASSSPQNNTCSPSSQGFVALPLESQTATVTRTVDRSQARLPHFFQPPSPRIHLESGFDISDPNIIPSKHDRNNQSDSGYDSSSFVMPNTLPSTADTSSFNGSASSSQTLPPPEGSREATGHADGEAPLTQSKSDSNLSGGSDHLNSEPYFSENIFDWELDYAEYANLPSFDTDYGFGNYDFPQN